MGNHADIFTHIQSQILATPTPISEVELLDPDWVPDVPFNDPPVAAAVLIALVERANGLSVVFTLRSKGLRAHSGQIAFPGGKLDASDVNPGAGAVREAQEEIALNPNSAKLLGYMPSCLTGTNYLVTPVVASISGDPIFEPNPLEVDEIFEVPLDFMLAPTSFTKLSLTKNSRVYFTWQLIHGEYEIWGITANLAYQFIQTAFKGWKNP